MELSKSPSYSRPKKAGVTADARFTGPRKADPPVARNQQWSGSVLRSRSAWRRSCLPPKAGHGRPRLLESRGVLSARSAPGRTARPAGGRPRVLAGYRRPRAPPARDRFQVVRRWAPGRFVPRHPPLAEVGLALARAAPRRSSAPVRSDPTSGRRNTLAASAAPAAGEPAARREPDALAAPVAAVRGGLTSGSRRRGSGILHHATTISIRGDSYRLKDKLKSGVVKPTTAGA